jgi:hypothetical protein
MTKPFLSHASVTIAALALALSAQAAPPSNDACAAATTIPALELPFATTLDTTQATADGDPTVTCVTPAPGKSVWYKFEPETSDAFVFDASSSLPGDYQPVLSLYTSSWRERPSWSTRRSGSP